MRSSTRGGAPKSPKKDAPNNAAKDATRDATKDTSRATDAGPRSETPVMRQHRAAKEQYPDALLFFRMGDFYELFYEDAVIAARALDLTLTARNKGAVDEIPMAGVPHHAASSYIQRLLDAGFKVAICEQMADPAKTKGIVPREVVRVVTPSIVFDDLGLVSQENAFLVGVDRDGSGFGIGALDVSTGELIACVADDEETAVAEIVRLDPREVLIAPSAKAIAERVKLARSRAAVREQTLALDLAGADAELNAILGNGEAARSCDREIARIAAGRAIAYARACEPGRALPVTRLAPYALGDTLVLDETTQTHLELVRTLDGGTKGALFMRIDETRTPPGARLLRRRLLAPKTNVGEIRRRLDCVELFVTQPGLRAEIRDRLGRVSDLERLSVKLAMGRAGPRDLAALRASLVELPPIEHALSTSRDPSAREALLEGASDASLLDTCVDACALLSRALADDPPARASDGGAIREGFDAELDEARSLARDGQRHIVELETRLRESAQIASLKLRYTRVFGWYIEVTRSHIAKAPESWRRKQTIATGERFTCDELDHLADKLAHAEERSEAREAELFARLVRDLATHGERFRAACARLSAWDVASALAEVAHKDDYARPEVDDSLAIEIEDGRHPVVEALAAQGRFVPNDVELDAAKEARAAGDERARLWLVTGPNMAGKSTFMRQIALIVVLAQMGSFVPARRARIGVVDRVLTRVGASDNLSRGESTFMVEMKETANVLRRATKRSLVVLDEIGRGTSTYDGLAIAWAVAEYLHDAIGCRALFATHYHELTALEETRPAAQNHSVSAREHEGDIVFFHKVQRGAASRSYGVACARLAGLPEPVLARARAVLSELESGAAPVGRGRKNSRESAPQLALFAPAVPHPAIETLRAVDVDRLTPLDALNLVASLKRLAEDDAKPRG